MVPDERLHPRTSGARDVGGYGGMEPLVPARRLHADVGRRIVAGELRPRGRDVWRRWLFIALSCVLGAGALSLGLVLQSGPRSSTLSSASLASGSGTTSGSAAPAIPTPGGATSGAGGFDAVACSSATVCTAVGAGPDGRGLIETTADAGASWSADIVPPGVPELDSVACSSGPACVAVGPNTLLFTTDGGSTWKMAIPPIPGTTALGVACTTESLCVAVGILPNPTGPYSGKIFVSADAGATWSSASMPDGVPGLAAVTCPTSTRCIAVGATILTTDDSGATWQQRTVNGGTQVLSSVACSSSQLCTALGPNTRGFVDLNAPSAAIGSTDGGNSWNQLGFPAGTSGLQRLSCGAGGRCLAVGATFKGASPLLASSPDGDHWALGTPPGQMSSLAGVTCLGSSECVAVGTGSTPGPAAEVASGSTWTAGQVGAS